MIVGFLSSKPQRDALHAPGPDRLILEDPAVLPGAEARNILGCDSFAKLRLPARPQQELTNDILSNEER